MRKYVPVKDITKEVGDRRVIAVGDIHGCFDEFQEGLAQLNYKAGEDILISLGDLIDRGPKSFETVLFFMTTPLTYVLYGNHDERFARWLRGNKVSTTTHGMPETLESFKKAGVTDYGKFFGFFISLPYIIKYKDNYFVHAGFYPSRKPEEQTREDCIFMRFTGGRDYFDKENGRYWFDLLPTDYPKVFFGHEVFFNDHKFANCTSLDGGCVFGGKLRFWDFRTDSLLEVQAKKTYSV